jgi:hypothetical protein
MKAPVEPPRLLDPRAGADPELREALRLVSSDLPSGAVVDAIADNVSRSLGHGTSLGGSASAVGQSLWLKTLSVAALVVVGGSSLWWARPAPLLPRTESAAELVSRPPSASPAVARPAAAQGALNPRPAPAEEASTLSEPPRRLPAVVRAPASADAPRAGPSIRAARAHSQPGPPAASSGANAPGAPVLAEQGERPAERGRDAPPPQDDAALELIARAQRALALDPARALTLLSLHRERYPRGGLAEERDVLSLDAMARLGMRRELAQRAQEFLQRYPQSMYRERVALMSERAEHSGSP